MVAHSRAVARKSLESPWVDAAIVQFLIFDHSSCRKIQPSISVARKSVDSPWVDAAIVHAFDL